MKSAEPISRASKRPAGRVSAVGTGGVVVMTGTIPALLRAGAPWWAIALVGVVLTAIGCGLVLAQLVLPQESGDRLKWWRDLRRNRTTRHPSRRGLDGPVEHSRRKALDEHHRHVVS